MVSKLWRSVMDSDKNALLNLPRSVRFQIMFYLSAMWSLLFCVSFGIMIWAPAYMIAHVAILLIGIFGTGWIFRITNET